MTPKTPVVAAGVPSTLAPAEQPSRACPHQGCRVPSEMVRFKASDGRLYCISHTDDQTAKQGATRKGGYEKRRRESKVMPPGSPDPDWSTPKAIRAWAEDRGGRVERGELDLRRIPQELAKLARATHEIELLTKLDDLEGLIRRRLGGES